MEIKELSKYYGDFCAVNKVNFSYCSGRLTALVGRNGSGKTTAIRSILGLIKRDNGTIYIDGERSELNIKKVGYLAEERGLFLKETVQNQLIFFARLKGLSHKDALKSVDRWLERLEVFEYRKRPLESLSKGNQQKIQVIASLVHNPDMIIFDEPFSGLDPVNMQLVIQLLKQLRDEGKCILVVSHQLPLIENVCEDICIMHKSDIVYSGSLQDLKALYGGDYVKFSLITPADIPKSINAEEYAPLNYKVKINSNADNDFNSFIRRIADSQLLLSSIERSYKSLQEIFLDLVGEEEIQ
jgi:ABC-2 type transport system ATP-binding protein